jgi:hypothetical protein
MNLRTLLAAVASPLIANYANAQDLIYQIKNSLTPEEQALWDKNLTTAGSACLLHEAGEIQGHIYFWLNQPEIPFVRSKDCPLKPLRATSMRATHASVFPFPDSFSIGASTTFARSVSGTFGKATTAPSVFAIAFRHSIANCSSGVFFK